VSLRSTATSGGNLIFNGSAAGSGVTSGNNVYALMLAPGLEVDVLAGGNVSVRLFAGDAGVSGVFNSRSFGTAASRPVLTVQAVPEPGTVGLVGVAVIVAAGLLQRRRRSCV